MREPNLIAICISDIHLSLLRPACRADKDWMKTQAWALEQVRTIAEENQVPVLCAGDIFDKPKPLPELVNFALRALPDGMLCVPGQHDLPNHRIEAIPQSGYGTLKEAGKIIDLSGGGTKRTKHFLAFGFGWEEDIKPPKPPSAEVINVAVIHRYCWTEEKKYPGAPESAYVNAYRKELKGYDVAIFGDNHMHFIDSAGDCVVYNCGGLLRRKSDEILRRPGVGLLYSDGTIKRKKLDTSLDIFNEEVEERPEAPLDMRAFIKGLEALGEAGMDFKTIVNNHLRKDDIEEGVKEIIRKALEQEC